MFEKLRKVLKPYVYKNQEPGEMLLDNNINDQKAYNAMVKESIKNEPGVYLWINPNKENEVVYIGKAGTRQQNGDMKSQTLTGRLKAPRGKNKDTKKDISTYYWLKAEMNSRKIMSLRCYAFYTKDDKTPAYVEALLLQAFYDQKRRLPCLNKSF